MIRNVCYGNTFHANLFANLQHTIIIFVVMVSNFIHVFSYTQNRIIIRTKFVLIKKYNVYCSWDYCRARLFGSSKISQ